MSRKRYCEHCKKDTMQDWLAKDFICRKCHRIVNYRVRGGKKT
jgi:hypothetical protein